ncbi:hypothetical protein D9M68_324050 [compost metagenome]
MLLDRRRLGGTLPERRVLGQRQLRHALRNEQRGVRLAQGQQAAHAGIGEHEAEAVGGIGRVQRQVGAAGLEDADDGRQRLGRTLGIHADRLVAADALAAQCVGDPVGAALQFRVAPGHLALAHGDALGASGDLRFEQLLQARLGRQRQLRALLEGGDARAFGLAQHADAGRGLVEIGQGVAGEHLELLQPQRRAPGVDALGAPVEAQAAVALAGQLQQRQAGGVQAQFQPVGVGLGFHGAGVVGDHSAGAGQLGFVQAFQPGARLVEAGAEAVQRLAQAGVGGDVQVQRQAALEAAEDALHLFAAAIHPDAEGDARLVGDAGEEGAPEEGQQLPGRHVLCVELRQQFAVFHGQAGRFRGALAGAFERQALARRHAAHLRAPVVGATHAEVFGAQFALPGGVVDVLQHVLVQRRQHVAVAVAQVAGQPRQRHAVEARQRRTEEDDKGLAPVDGDRLQRRGVRLAEGFAQALFGALFARHAERRRRIADHLHRPVQAVQPQVAGAQHFVARQQAVEDAAQARLVQPAGDGDAGDGGQRPAEGFLQGEHGGLLRGEGEGFLVGGQLHGHEPQSSARSALFWAIAIAVRILRGPVNALRACSARMLSSSTTSPRCQGNSTITSR